MHGVRGEGVLGKIGMWIGLNDECIGLDGITLFGCENHYLVGQIYCVYYFTLLALKSCDWDWLMEF